MKLLLFMVIISVELFLAGSSIIIKSKQYRNKCVTRIIVLICFIFLLVIDVMSWDMRYYALGLFLIIATIISLIVMIWRDAENNQFSVVGQVVKTIVIIFILFLVSIPIFLFESSEPLETTGVYDVLTAEYALTDTKRIETYSETETYRELNIKVWYPKKSDKKCPLIVFSHGALGIKTSNVSLYNELASHGYVVCSIDHKYQCLFTQNEDHSITFVDKTYMNECMIEDAQVNKLQSYEFYEKWMDIRMNDMSFVIDYILGESTNHQVFSLVDTDKLGVMGHSLGGAAALGLGRIRSDIDAVIALESPFMYDIEGVEEDAFIFTDADYEVPVLNVYSDSSWHILGERPQYRRNYEMLDDSLDSTYNVYIEGVGHFTLTDLALKSPILTNMLNGTESITDPTYCLRTINEVSLEFFDFYLKEEENINLDEKY